MSDTTKDLLAWNPMLQRGRIQDLEAKLAEAQAKLDALDDLSHYEPEDLPGLTAGVHGYVLEIQRILRGEEPTG